VPFRYGKPQEGRLAMASGSGWKRSEKCCEVRKGSQEQIAMNELVEETGAKVFEIERQADTIIVTPVLDLNEFEFQRIEVGAGPVLQLLEDAHVKNVVMDFHRVDYFGSTALGFFLKIWKRVRKKDGHMALCNVSDHEKEILKVTMLDSLWPICASREEAMRAVRK
jgi:anti-anti-sigma factor